MSKQLTDVFNKTFISGCNCESANATRQALDADRTGIEISPRSPQGQICRTRQIGADNSHHCRLLTCGVDSRHRVYRDPPRFALKEHADRHFNAFYLFFKVLKTTQNTS